MHLEGSEIEFQYFKWKDEFDNLEEIPLENKEVLPMMKITSEKALREDIKIWEWNNDINYKDVV